MPFFPFTPRHPKVFVVGDLSSPVGSRPIKIIDTGVVGEDVKPGDHISRWGWLMEFGEGCINIEELEKLRHQGDPASDDVVRFFSLKAGDDGLKRLEAYVVETPREDWDPVVATFWNEVSIDPPEGVSALSAPLAQSDKGKQRQTEQDDLAHHQGLEYTCDAATLRRNRKPQPRLAEGQAVFWRYSADMFGSLLHFSLAGGFAAPRIMSVLRETGYLTSKSRDATYRRLMETSQALVDFMTDMTPLTGRGWKSAIRVRLLHSQVRVRILDRRSRLNTYDLERDGLPINQEDLAATLGGFCLAPLWCQRRLGVRLSHQEELAFVAAWRHVGYYLGISPDLLRTYFPSDGLPTATRSHRFFACVAFHLFTPEPPADPFGTPTYAILNAVADRPPSNTSTLHHCELSRFLLGPGLADQLAIPRGSWRNRLAIQKHAWTSWLTSNFSAVYRGGWEIKRQALFRRVIVLIVAWQLGERRSTFTWKEAADHEKKISELVSDEAGESSGLEFGIAIGKEVRSQAMRLFAEMGIVVAGTALLSATALAQSARLAWAWYSA